MIKAKKTTTNRCASVTKKRLVRSVVSKPKATSFKIHAPSAQRVSVAGTFNNWDPQKISAKKDLKGYWTVRMGLHPGRYEYKFVVDGNWILDPKCNSKVVNNFGTENSVIEIK